MSHGFRGTMRRGKRSRRDLLAAGLLATGLSRIAGWDVRAARAETSQVVLADGRRYDAYVDAALKPGQFASYTCEFDAAWVICKTFGFEVPLAEQIDIVGIDERIEPYVAQTPAGGVIYGGDIDSMFSGDYTSSFLARARSRAMRKVFDAYGLPVEVVSDRPGLEAALRRGGLIWVKSTVDYQPFEPVTWITPEGKEFPDVLSNAHAVVVIGYNADVVVIRDLLGPTGSNWQRAQEYEVPWSTFMTVWDGQGRDGVAVFPLSAATASMPIMPGVEISGGLTDGASSGTSSNAPLPAIEPQESAPTEPQEPAPTSPLVMPVEITGSL